MQLCRAAPQNILSTHTPGLLGTGPVQWRTPHPCPGGELRELPRPLPGPMEGKLWAGKGQPRVSSGVVADPWLIPARVGTAPCLVEPHHPCIQHIPSAVGLGEQGLGGAQPDGEGRGALGRCTHQPSGGRSHRVGGGGGAGSNTKAQSWACAEENEGPGRDQATQGPLNHPEPSSL